MPCDSFVCGVSMDPTGGRNAGTIFLNVQYVGPGQGVFVKATTGHFAAR